MTGVSVENVVAQRFVEEGKHYGKGAGAFAAGVFCALGDNTRGYLGIEWHSGFSMAYQVLKKAGDSVSKPKLLEAYRKAAGV